MIERRITWSEEATDTYQRIAAIAVPYRAEQIAAMLTLLPFNPGDRFRVVELGSGEGRLAAAVMEAYPQARVMALDGSAAMRETSRERLAVYGDRFEVGEFDLLDDSWWPHLDGAQVVLSSLVVHHLDGPGKRRLFQEAQSRLKSPALLLVADLVLASHPRANELYAGLYDRVAELRSQELIGSDAYFQDFLREEWNFYRYPDEDDWDKPSRLYEQLRWLEEAGFDTVDCFWMQAGHAIYGGYKGAPMRGDGLEFSRALEVARWAVGE